VLAGCDIFNLQAQQGSDYVVTASFFEIYCGKLFDLLNDRQLLHPREDAKGVVNIVGLSEKKVASIDQLMKTIDQGIAIRVTGRYNYSKYLTPEAQNSANTDSSRSHAILQISIRNQKQLIGKLSFIDLAGSERGADVVDSNK
jgi:kinesin family member 2/24